MHYPLMIHWKKNSAWLMVFNATFNNISVISWRTVLLVEDTRVPWENHRPVISHWQTLPHKVVSITPRHEQGSNSHFKWWYVLIAHVVINPTTIRSRSLRPLLEKKEDRITLMYVINYSTVLFDSFSQTHPLSNGQNA